MENHLNILSLWTLVNAYCVFAEGFHLGQSNLTCDFLLRILKNNAGSYYPFMLKNIQNRKSRSLKMSWMYQLKPFPILYMTFQQYLTQNSGRLYKRIDILLYWYLSIIQALFLLQQHWYSCNFDVGANRVCGWWWETENQLSLTLV